MSNGEFSRMIEFLDAAWYLRSEIVPCLIGAPGIGKTSAIRKHAETHGSGHVEVIVASRCVPSETVGMTMPNDSKRTMDIYNSAQLSRLKDGDILFLDELLEADQMVLSTMLTMIESRTLADGTPLPDIQIVAATNDTISSSQLRLNIRQRFMFMSFDWTPSDVREFVMEKTGIKISQSVMDHVTTHGNDYNVLTPRTVSKLYLWMDATPEDELDTVAKVINNMYLSGIGNYIYSDIAARNLERKKPENQIRREVKKHVNPEDLPSDFDNLSLDQLIKYLTSLPDWEEISQELANAPLDGVLMDDGDTINF